MIPLSILQSLRNLSPFALSMIIIGCIALMVLGLAATWEYCVIRAERNRKRKADEAWRRLKEGL